VVVLEKEHTPGQHASGRNSGVLHAGFYYAADSLKARLTRDGNRELTEYCLDRAIPINQCGKLVVAKNESELDGLDTLLKRGRANGVEVEVITAADARTIEPRVKTFTKALYSPTTSTVNPGDVMRELCKDLVQANIELITGARYLQHKTNRVVTTKGNIDAGYIINAAGLYADKIARLFGFSKDFTILPFKGLYLYMTAEAGQLDKHIYPVPDINNPFLGVHITITVDGHIKIGPTAIPAFWRENYTGLKAFNLSEFMEITGMEMNLLLSNQFGFRQLAIQELQKYSRARMVKLASAMVEGIEKCHLKQWGKPGIRAQLVNIKTRQLVMDFCYEGDDRSFHVLNAVSPAFTCAMPFSRLMVDEIEKRVA
jgi:L-2-hydroxyglutarate oxidase LhgO